MSDAAQKTATLAAKIVRIAKACGYIAKDGTNQQQNYKFLSAAAVLARFGPACVEAGIACTTKFETLTPWDAKTSIGKNQWNFARVKCVISLVDAESGECWTTEGLGDGADGGDKAVMKAQTAARREAIKALCNTSTSEDADPERDEETDSAQRDRTPPKGSPAQPVASLDFVFERGEYKGRKIRDLTPAELAAARAGVDGVLPTAPADRKPYLLALLGSLLLALPDGQAGAKGRAA